MIQKKLWDKKNQLDLEQKNKKSDRCCWNRALKDDSPNENTLTNNVFKMIKTSYSQAILEAFQYLLKNYPEVFVLGQGLWSPWYVGKTMENLDKKFGKSRIIDTPVSESACTGAAVGASICGMKPIVVHPRMDFMLYAMDAIVNQAAKWSYMFDGKSNPSLTIRAIINRGGSQGAQHSQALQSWFAHIPGLRVVMPYSVQDARDLLISSVLCPDPVIYIDDRWLYEQTSFIKPIEEKKIDQIEPKIILEGNDLTLVGSSYSTHLAKEAAKNLAFWNQCRSYRYEGDKPNEKLIY